MTNCIIPVELSDAGFMGTVRDNGQPDLVAHRPEAWRFMRLARVIGATKAIAKEELGSEASLAIVEAMIWVSDMKGDFTVCWHPTKHRSEYNDIVTRALATERETEIQFQLGDDT